MKTKMLASLAPLLLGCYFAEARTNAPIPWDQIGARAGADYKGDGVALTLTPSGARLHCAFQRLDGETTSDGLWLTSTVPDQPKDRFHVTAIAVGRHTGVGDEVTSLTFSRHLESDPPIDSHLCQKLATTGSVSVDGRTVCFIRPGLIEEFSVSMDGVRQDFVVLEKPTAHPLTRSLSPSDGKRVTARSGEGRCVWNWT